MEQGQKKKNKFLETVESIGIALLIALAIRALVIEPFKIPSISMVPTLLVGDQIFVNKFVYGLRIPFTKKRFWEGRDPKRGEVVIFFYPKDEKLDYIKRVVGLPGDTIRADGDKVYVNGELVVKQQLTLIEDPKHTDRVFVQPADPYKQITLFPEMETYTIYQEKLGESYHFVQHDYPFYPDKTYVIPPGHYFVMGDNRDHSADSREWGFLPRKNLKGRAMFIWLSFDWDRPWYDVVRWHRFGRWIY